MDDLLILAGYDIQRPQRRPMAASKPTATSAAANAVPESRGEPAVNDGVWDWGTQGWNSSVGVEYDDIFGPKSAFERSSSTVGGFDLMSSSVVSGDMLENLGKERPFFGIGGNVSEEKVKDGNSSEFTELIPGFGVSKPNSPAVRNVEKPMTPEKRGSNYQQSSKLPEAKQPSSAIPGIPTGHTVDPLVNFKSDSSYVPSPSRLFTNLFDDIPVSMNFESPNVSDFPTKNCDVVQDPLSFFANEVNVTAMKSDTQSRNNASGKRQPNQSSSIDFLDDMNFSFGEFQETEGKSDGREKNKIDRDLKTRIRVARALEEKNERDMQVQREQAEKHRIAETLDIDIKRWAAGKEGNLRALLSSLQNVLGPESGWQPVSLTDLITAQAVKKVYKKAALYIHPDKVQQRGASIHQKYIAEKVFDIIKEAYKKFESEELV